MSINVAFALIVVLITIYALIKRYETRCVLLASGFAMAIFSLKPMIAFQQFDASMTRSSLIIAICSAMGFAATISLTKCDVHLVALLTKPLREARCVIAPRLHVCNRSLCSSHPFHSRTLRHSRTFHDPDFD